MVNKPLDKKRRDLTIVCLSSLLLALTGCGESGGPGGPPGAHPMGMGGPPGALRSNPSSIASVGPPGVGPGAMGPAGIASPRVAQPAVEKDKPAPALAGDKKDDNPMASISKVEVAGDLLSLATELIEAGVNPFLSRLPRPLQPEAGTTEPSGATGGNAPPPPPPADPLDSVRLLGIVYNPKSPIALVAVANAQYPSQVVRVGDVVALETGPAIIRRITQESIDIQLMGPQQKEKRTMVLPDIVGYSSSQSSQGGQTGGASQESPGGGLGGGLGGGEFGSGGSLGMPGAPKSAPPSMNQGAVTKPSNSSSPLGNMGMNGATLSNLKRLAAGLTGGSGSNVGLTEP